MGRISRVIAHFIAILVGVPASFVAGAAVFADGPPILSAERIVPVALTYLAVGRYSASAADSFGGKFPGGIGASRSAYPQYLRWLFWGRTSALGIKPGT